jgi:CBS domain-containing protein
VGVLDDVDLLASEHRTPFRLRALIARGADVPAVAAAAAELSDVVVALHEADLPAHAICRTISGIHDATTRRLVALAHHELGAPPVPYTWLAMGSFGRREAFPSSDVDCAVAWEGPDEDPGVSDPIRRVAEQVLEGLARSGFAPDDKGAVASSPLFARSVKRWEEAARAWVGEPDRDRGLMLLSVVVESDPVWGQTLVADRLFAAFARSERRQLMLNRLLAAALAARPPTGFLRDFVLQSSGERRGVLDIKRGGLLPIESVARWAGLAAGVAAASTPARLDAARDAGTLPDEDVAILSDAFELVSELRMEHQVDQLRAGEAPDDLIEPKRLAPLTRAALKDAFRGVRRVQRRLDAERTLARY